MSIYDDIATLKRELPRYFDESPSGGWATMTDLDIRPIDNQIGIIATIRVAPGFESESKQEVIDDARMISRSYGLSHEIIIKVKVYNR